MIVIMSISITDQLLKLPGRVRDITEGMTLFYQNDPVEKVFVLTEGSIALSRHQRGGSVVVLQHAEGRSVLAEASVYSDVYHCDAKVSRGGSIYEIRKSEFEIKLRKDAELSNTWAAHLAVEVQRARGRIEILSKKTVAEKLEGWLAWHDGELPAKGRWKNIAVELGISPEAFYRELARRRNNPGS